MNTHLEARPGTVCLCAWFRQVGVENIADGLEVSMNLFWAKSYLHFSLFNLTTLAFSRRVL